MLLSQTKVKELEFLAFKLRVDPDLLIDALISIGFTEKLAINEAQTVKLPTPEEKVKAIEEEALNKGWTYEQLWATSNNTDYSKKGLVYFLEDGTTIGEVTEKHISLIHERPVGGTVIHNFYNMRVEQPWIKKIENKKCDGINKRRKNNGKNNKKENSK